MTYEPLTSHGFLEIMTMNILFIYSIFPCIFIKIVKPCSEMQILSIVKCYGPSPFINQYEMPVISQDACVNRLTLLARCLSLPSSQTDVTLNTVTVDPVGDPAVTGPRV